ncbi:hypothetical protein H8356DRAFT_1436303 [Neocallimastix lanati (nom. inval.)]|nr:hypothetical protein H8356DRAFT_1436303 [Neocallimastix sp. JGI-2020a]
MDLIFCLEWINFWVNVVVITFALHAKDAFPYTSDIIPEIALSNLKKLNNNTEQNNNFAFSVNKNHKINQSNEYHDKKYKFPKKQRKIEKLQIKNLVNQNHQSIIQNIFFKLIPMDLVGPV